ncbi:M48 family metallopeptidase [Myxococcota bacterium]
MAPLLLFSFIALKLLQQVIEHGLARLNWRFVRDEHRQERAARRLGISAEAMRQSHLYSLDRYRFGVVQSWVSTTALLAWLAAGGLGWLERFATTTVGRLVPGSVAAGLAFFLGLGVISFSLSLPFSVYETFVLEQRHGFNRQTPRGFFLDTVKAVLLTLMLGGGLAAVVLWLIERSGPLWWLWAWIVVTAFSVLTSWLYPRVLAPLFNRFAPLPDGSLRDEILRLAMATGFSADGIFVMDASRRSAHGNAYFTGLFGHKRIVLFDTLIEALVPRAIVAVLAHELGHFKLGHVRWHLALGIGLSGVLFWVLGQCWQLRPFYQAFQLSEPSAHGALVVFGLWFGPIGFLLQPGLNAVARRHERAADAFALQHVPARDLADALLQLREKSHRLPLSHPVYSVVYHSHPPLLSRLESLGVGVAPDRD